MVAAKAKSSDFAQADILHLGQRDDDERLRDDEGIAGRGVEGGFEDPALAREVLVPLRVRAGGQILSFFSTTTVFGSPVDVTLSELAIESFFPADAATAAAARKP